MERKLLREDIANPEEIPLLDNLECSIDMMISLNPKMCLKCENIFCQECVENWAKKSSDCPMRCKPFEHSTIENSILKFQINKIKLFCGYKFEGCKEIFLINEKEKHDQVCQYKPTQCIKCKKLVPKILLNEHYYKTCEKTQIKCNQCENNFSLNDFILHYENCVTNQNTKCRFCIKKIPSNKMGTHLEKCESKVDVCKICNMPDFAKRIEITHKHEKNENVDEIMSKNKLQSKD